MTKLITIIPAKPFEEAKTRLAAILSPQQRKNLSRILLQRTVSLAQQIGPVIVVSRSAEARQAARERGAETIAETAFRSHPSVLSPSEGSEQALQPSSLILHPSEASLNAAIRQGIAYVLATEAESALILPLDLPLLSLTDLQALLELSKTKDPALVIAPCRQNQGTNALLLRPPSLIAPQFGVNSFAAHQLAAREAGVTPKIYRSPGLMHDLDSPEDWHRLLKIAGKLSTAAPLPF